MHDWCSDLTKISSDCKVKSKYFSYKDLMLTSDQAAEHMHRKGKTMLSRRILLYNNT